MSISMDLPRCLGVFARAERSPLPCARLGQHDSQLECRETAVNRVQNQPKQDCWLIPILPDEVLEKSFVPGNILVSLEVAKFHMISKKHHLNPNTEQRHGHSNAVWSILFEIEMDTLLCQRVQEVEHTLQAIFIHAHPLFLFKSRLVKELIAFICGITASLFELKKIGYGDIIQLARKFPIDNTSTLARSVLPNCPRSKLLNDGRQLL